jgi:hypothetical protein
MSIQKTVSASAMMILAAAAFNGCSQTKVPAEVSQQLQSFKNEIVMGRGAFTATTGSLKDLRDSKGASLKPNFDAYAKAVDNLDSKAGGVGWVAAMSNERAEKYFKNWDAQIDSISDKDLRVAGEERHAQALAEFNKLKAMDADLRATFGPYMSRLGDIRTALAGDLTDQGLSKAKPTIDKAIDDEAEILKRVDAITKQIDAMSSR